MVTHRKGKVRIENATGNRLLSVSVGHKYSDNYKNESTWEGPIANGSQTKPENDFFVDYNTGLGTTGQDWWQVSYVTDKGEMYRTAPNNSRGVIDFVEAGYQEFLELGMPLALGVGATVAIFDPEPISKALVAAATASSKVTSTLINKALNSESTAGFKKHTLKEKDDDPNLPTIIKINGDNVVSFISQSGTSHTDAKLVKLKK